MKKKDTDGWGIASFVVSLFGFFFVFIPFIAIVFSILAVVFSLQQRKINKTGLSTAGLVIGILGIVMNVILLLIILLALLFAVSTL